VLAATGAAFLAGGCSSAVDPVVVSAGCPQQPLRGPEAYAGEPGEKLIDDFEDGDSRLAMVAGRNGDWILGSDGSSGMLTAETSARCAARGSRSGHFTGEGFNSWGANWTAVFRTAVDTALPWDGRAWGGISFWAALGERATPPYDVPVGVTTMDVAWNGGICASRCMDFYAKTVTLTPAWRRIEIRFDELKQGNWGDVQVPMRRDQLVGFIIWPNHQFDVWIDDLRIEPL
jgi:hypothetical protein